MGVAPPAISQSVVNLPAVNRQAMNESTVNANMRMEPSTTRLPVFTNDPYTATPLHHPQDLIRNLVEARTEDAPRKAKRPAEHSRDIGNALAKRALEFHQKQPTKENPFQLKDFREELKKFILCFDALPWNTPSKYREIKEGEDASSYQTQKKSHENKPPKIVNIFNHITPPIVRRSAYKGHLLTVDFAQSHRDIISKIFSLIHCTGWEGIYVFLPWTNMICTRYAMDITKPMHPCLNFIEAHRRVLKMEEACTELLQYLSATVECTHKQLLLMSANNLRDAFHALISNADGGLGSGEGFWSSQGSAHAAEHIAKVSPSAVTSHSPFTENMEWLKNNRKESLTRHCPLLTEFDWGMPLLGLLYSLLSPMGKLEDESEAQTVLATLMGFIDKRVYVYTRDIAPILLYGARLTQYTTDLQRLCHDFTCLGTKAGVPFTKAGRFYKLDRDGRLLGSDGRVVSNGLNTTTTGIAGSEKLLLPFPLEYINIVPEPGLQDLSRIHAEEEMKLVTSMLDDLNLDQSAQILAYMQAGHARVKKLLVEDTFHFKFTRILPSSASMPDAWYDPSAVFAPETGSVDSGQEVPTV